MLIMTFNYVVRFMIVCKLNAIPTTDKAKLFSKYLTVILTCVFRMSTYLDVLFLNES